MVEAVDEAAIHGVVHLVGYAQGMATFPPFGGIAREVAFGFLEGFIARKVAAVGKLEGGDGIFLSVALCAAEGLHAAVGAGRLHVKLEQDASPPDGADERVADVGAFGGHGDKIVHAVTTMKSEKPGNGAKAVGRVGVSAVTAVELYHPRAFLGFKKVVDIGTFQVGDVAKKTFSYHLLHG